MKGYACTWCTRCAWRVGFIIKNADDVRTSADTYQMIGPIYLHIVLML